jgi:DNA-binding CsgD family transcriptional regulator
LLGLVDRLCVSSPVVVVAEDLQWADEASVLVWERLARATGQVPLLVVGSLRPGTGRGDLNRLVRGVVSVRGTVVELGPLGRGEVAELAVGLVGARPGRGLLGVLGRAGGNPLYVGELADGLVRAGRVRVAAGVAELEAGLDEVEVPVSLQAAIGERLAVLSAGVMGVLRWAAVLGQEFSVIDLSVVTGRGAGELAGVVEQAMAAGVVAEVGSRLGFRHGLIRQVLYEGVPVALREFLHVEAARALAGVAAAPERVAAQLVAAPGAGCEWVREWLAGAVGVLGYRAPRVAAELLRWALAQLPDEDPRREVLQTALVTVAFLLVEDEEVERVARPLLARTADPDRAAEVAWLLAYSLVRTGRAKEAVPVEEQALARPGVSEAWAARLLARQAITTTQVGQLDQAAEIAGRALAGADRAGDRFAAGYALHALSYLTVIHRHDQAAGLGHIDRALAVIGDDPQTTDLRLLLLANRAGGLEGLDRHVEAGAAIRQALALAERAGTPRLMTISAIAAEHYFLIGQWDDALAVLETTAVLPGPNENSILLHVLAALIAGHRDDWATAEEHLAAVRGLETGSASFLSVADCLLRARVLAAERAGLPGEAVAVLALCLDPGVGEDMPNRYVLLRVLTQVALAAGDAAIAAAAARAAAQEADREPLPVITAAAGWCAGLVDGDPGPVLAAAGYYQEAGRPFERAVALEDAAVLLAGRGDQAAARSAFRQAAYEYDDLGAVWDLRRADARLRRYGIQRGRGGKRARATHGWQALTPTESKVASLVAGGRSNPDIAGELFLSRNTVQTHVSHILAKLGARSRAEIIRQVVEQARGAKTAG